MKEYDWRKEREKYRFNPVGNGAEQSPEPAPVPEQPQKRASSVWLRVLVIVIAAAVVAAGVLVLTGSLTDSSKMLAKAAEKNKNAVALVTFTTEFKTGRKETRPIGTAWAFAKDKFATNAHVANAFRSASKAVVQQTAQTILLSVAKKNNCPTVDEFLKRLGKKKAQLAVIAATRAALAQIREFRADVIINGTQKKSFPVTHVQIHRDYGVAGSSISPDIAVLTISGKHDKLFKLASIESLHKLKSGEAVAFLGFPSEYLVGGNINIDNPVASMQSGIIVAVSNFELKDAGAEGNILIRHNLPSTGGASGSPIFNRDGEVVALLFAGNIIGQVRDGGVERAPSAAQINYGIRVDLISGMGNMIAFKDFLK